jgi:hypothetical protein
MEKENIYVCVRKYFGTLLHAGHSEFRVKEIPELLST